MVDSLLDTAILVDVLRKHPPALSWLTTQQHPGVTSVVWLELIEGAWDKTSQQQVVKLLKDFERVDMQQTDLNWATRQLLRFNLSHGVDMYDCLIASASKRLDIPLYTPNLKHFVPLLGSLAQQPY